MVPSSVRVLGCACGVRRDRASAAHSRDYTMCREIYADEYRVACSYAVRSSSYIYARNRCIILFLYTYVHRVHTP